MNKKKLGLLVLSLVLIATIGVGATLAYFTDADKATNTITMGHVDIDLDEPNYDPEDDDDTVEDIVPGQVITKDPTITVDKDSEDAYIRAKIVLDTDLTEAQKTDLLANITVKDGWYYSSQDNYYYYKDIVNSNTKSTRNYYDDNNVLQTEEVSGVVLFDMVKIPEKWGNEVANMTFTIDVVAEGIQAEGFAPEKNNDGLITGWYYTNANGEKEAITAQNWPYAPETPAAGSGENAGETTQP